MSEPREANETEGNNLRPGQHDEGGHGGMATRELEAEDRAAQAEDGAGRAEDSAG
ncbi:hypothetical protein [Trujillonella humicola]|uniref:hypothetical protein n=1 Tax=Trujillonella humicola TaxID=3383699 RepID=UPI0039066172